MASVVKARSLRRVSWQCVFLCYRARLSWCFRLLLLLRLRLLAAIGKGRSRAHVLFALLYEREMRTEFGGGDVGHCLAVMVGECWVWEVRDAVVAHAFGVPCRRGGERPRRSDGRSGCVASTASCGQ